MGLIEPGLARRIVELDAVDAEAGFRLSAEAGWNQSAADWAMMLTAGKGFGVKENGALVATSLALPYPPAFGWVSMVLVAAARRRCGLATALLGHAVDHLKGLGLTPMLDATPAGREVYLPLGFRDGEQISRWRGRGAGLGGRGEAFDREAAFLSDRSAFGADRSAILADLEARPGRFAISLPSGGFALSRVGAAATQIGPLVARRSEEAIALLGEALDAIAGPLLIDAPDRGTVMAELLRRRGFTIERPFTRMALGRREPFGQAGWMRAIAGPELG